MVIRKFKKQKSCSLIKGNIWVADLAGMQLISKYNKGIRLLLWVDDGYVVDGYGYHVMEWVHGVLIMSLLEIFDADNSSSSHTDHLIL